MRRREIAAQLDDIVEFAGIEQFMDTPVKRYSSGMYVRLAFSVAAHLEPEILLVDEVLAVGDAEFQSVPRPHGGSRRVRSDVLFVSHQMQAIAQLCDRAIWLDGGQVALDGPSGEVVAQYLQSGIVGGSSREWDRPGHRARERSRAYPLGSCRSGRRRGRCGGRSPASGNRDRLQGARGAESRCFRRSRSSISAVTWRSTPWIPTRAGSSRHRPGDYVATAVVPANFLNEGLVSVHVAVCSLGTHRLEHHFQVHDAVSFHVQDPGEGDSARGMFAGQWKGVVRPLLDWTCVSS